MKERTKEFISTTATAVEKLKRQAKNLRKTTRTSLAVAQDDVAKKNCYLHWKHVTVCLANTSTRIRSQPLPNSLQHLLDQTAERHPASIASQEAFASGFVFAMDVKDAQELSLGADYAECDDGRYLAAKHLWPALVHFRDEETGTPLTETQSAEELATTALDDLQNYRFFRCLRAAIPAPREVAYQWISEMSFFPPTHIWLGGKVFDLGEVTEIRVDGQVVLSATPGFTVLMPTAERTRPGARAHPVRRGLPSGLVPCN